MTQDIAASPFLDPAFTRGFGTFPLDGEALIEALETALKVGYRAIDTAQSYGNEAAVGEALRHADVPRDSLLVTTKIAPDNMNPRDFWPSLEASLKALDCSQIDCLLLHWPDQHGNNTQALALLQEAQARGLARHIGVSNYTIAMMQAAAAQLDAPIACNQIEFHPLLDQSQVAAAARALGIPLSAYCAVARGRALSEPTILAIAQETGLSPAQVTLSWILAKGVAYNAMSTKPQNIAGNFAADGKSLSAEQIARMDVLGQQYGYRIVDASKVPSAPAWD